MSDGKIMILQMLQDGKIDVEQTISLLEAFECNCQKKNDDLQHKINKLSKCVDGIAKDLGSKFDQLYKNMEPKVKKTTCAIMQKTADVASNLASKFSE